MGYESPKEILSQSERVKYLGGLQVPFKSHMGCLYIFKDKGLVQKEQHGREKRGV